MASQLACRQADKPPNQQLAASWLCVSSGRVRAWRYSRKTSVSGSSIPLHPLMRVKQAYKYHDQATPNNLIYYSFPYPLNLLMNSFTGKGLNALSISNVNYKCTPVSSLTLLCISATQKASQVYTEETSAVRFPHLHKCQWRASHL